MAVTGQTYAERAASEGLAGTFTLDSFIRVGEVLLTIEDFITNLLSLGAIVSSYEVQAPSDAIPSLTVIAADNSPAVAPFKVTLADGTLLFEATTSFNTATTGYGSFLNTVRTRIYETTDQTDPGGSNGQYWIRPRAA